MTPPSRLTARPGPPSRPAPRSGTRELPGGVLAIPAGPPPWPLVVVFHGAGGTAAGALDLLARPAVERDVLLLAPQSAGATWDVIERGFGPDVQRLDQTLAGLFATCPVDAGRVAFAGFSDGASYALSLGLDNGDLAQLLIAFAPGFIAAAALAGRPRILVAHGVHDAVLPIDRTSRQLVPDLRQRGYDVTYEEFEGGHEVPPALAAAALDRLAAA